MVSQIGTFSIPILGVTETFIRRPNLLRPGYTPRSSVFALDCLRVLREIT